MGLADTDVKAAIKRVERSIFASASPLFDVRYDNNEAANCRDSRNALRLKRLADSSRISNETPTIACKKRACSCSYAPCRLLVPRKQVSLLVPRENVSLLVPRENVSPPLGMRFSDLSHDAVSHIALWLLQTNDFVGAQHLSWTCQELHTQLQALKDMAHSRRHHVRWAVRHLQDDVIIRGRGLKTVLGNDMSWRRAYGRPLVPKEPSSSWAVRIDRSRMNQGLMLLGVSLQSRTGQVEWCLCPFYGRVFRRTWDRDGNQLCGEPPPAGYPDGHLRHVLVDADGAPTNLEGCARGRVIDITLDHKEGSLRFKLDGGPEGPPIKGFPIGDPGLNQPLLKPVVGFRMSPSLSEDDQVTLRGAERLRVGWPRLDDERERDLRGVIAARYVAVGRALDTSGASNRMRLASFRLLHSPRGEPEVEAPPPRRRG